MASVEIGSCTVAIDKILYVKQYDGAATSAGVIVFVDGRELLISSHADVRKVKEALGE